MARHRTATVKILRQMTLDIGKILRQTRLVNIVLTQLAESVGCHFSAALKVLLLNLCHYWSQAYNLTQPWYGSPPPTTLHATPHTFKSPSPQLLSSSINRRSDERADSSSNGFVSIRSVGSHSLIQTGSNSDSYPICGAFASTNGGGRKR